MSSRSKSRLAIGATLGSYTLTERLGEGGMGVVFLAQHKVLGQPFALKILKPECAALDDLTDRFLEEARVTAAVHHPGVVEVYDFDVTSDGIVFFVMEYLAGETLRDRLRRMGRLPTLTALTIASRLASALAAAHELGIIHRDIKPENVYILDSGTAPRIKLFDFGIAKRAGGGSPTDKLTESGIILGTPSYMAPEQCRGQNIDARADLYALGCLLFEMLCGDPPFDHGDAADIMTAHMRAARPTPTSRVSGLSAELDDLVAGLLAERPSERLSDAGAVSDDLEAIAWNHSSSRLDPSRVDQARHASRSALVAAGAAGAMARFNSRRTLRWSEDDESDDGRSLGGRAKREPAPSRLAFAAGSASIPTIRRTPRLFLERAVLPPDDEEDAGSSEGDRIGSNWRTSDELTTQPYLSAYPGTAAEIDKGEHQH